MYTVCIFPQNAQEISGFPGFCDDFRLAFPSANTGRPPLAMQKSEAGEVNILAGLADEGEW
jgi:hypothetical protein